MRWGVDCKICQIIYKDLNFDILNMRDIHEIVLLYNYRTIGKYIVSHAFRVINRTEFDNELLKYYRHVGDTILDGQKSYKIDYEKNTISLPDNQKIQYRFLIGADGVNSKARSHIRHKRSFCIGW